MWQQVGLRQHPPGLAGDPSWPQPSHRKAQRSRQTDGLLLRASRFFGAGQSFITCCLVTKSCITLQPHGLQHARLSCPSPSPGALMSIELGMPSNHLILSRPLLLLPSILPSIRIFPNESARCIRWPKYWSFSISPSNEQSGLTSFRMDWLDLLTVQGTLKSLLQHDSSKASILWHSASFMVQLSHPYMTTGKTIALTIRTFVGKVMSLLFSMLSRLLL